MMNVVPDMRLLQVVPEVHGVRLVLAARHVVEGAVVERLQDEVELVVRRHPRVEPLLLPNLQQNRSTVRQWFSSRELSEQANDI